MEDVLTDIPPPSRFFLDDLNNFTPLPTHLPSPFLLFSTPIPKKLELEEASTSAQKESAGSEGEGEQVVTKIRSELTKTLTERVQGTPISLPPNHNQIPEVVEKVIANDLRSLLLSYKENPEKVSKEVVRIIRESTLNDKLNTKPLCPALLIVALSSPSLCLFHHVSSKTLIGAIILPEIPFSGNSVEPSLGDNSCNIYALNDVDELIIVVSVQYSVAAERARDVAKLLIGEQLVPKRVLILDSIQSLNFRGKLSADDTFAFKLETSLEREGLSDGSGHLPLLKGLDYFPSGSVVDGLAAALLSRCQMKKIKGTLCLSWPEYGASVTALVKNLLFKEVLSGLEHSIASNSKDQCLRVGRNKDHPPDSELYT